MIYKLLEINQSKQIIWWSLYIIVIYIFNQFKLSFDEIDSWAEYDIIDPYDLLKSY